MKNATNENNVWYILRVSVVVTLLATCLLPVFCPAQQPDWQLVTPPKLGIPTALGVSPSNPDRAFVTAEHDGAWEINPAQNPLTFKWTFAYYPYVVNSIDCPTLDPNQCPNIGLYEVHMMRFLAAPSKSTTLYTLGVYSSVTKSTDDGGSWTDVSSVGSGLTPDRHWYALAIAPTDTTGSTLLAGGWGAIRLSLDGGASWMTQLDILNTLTNPPTGAFVTDIEYADNQYVWAATADSAPYPEQAGTQPVCSGVYRSINYGYNWTQKLINSPGADPANCVYAVAPVVAPTPAACLTVGNCVYAATKAGLYFSSDGGGSWQRQTITNGSTNISASPVSDVFFSYGTAPNSWPTVYIGTAIGNSANDGVYKSTVIGGPLTRVAAFPLQSRVYALGGVAQDSNRLYVAYETGDLYKTTDGGINPSNTALLQGAHAGYPMSTIAIPSQPNNYNNEVYVGTVCQGGIYQRKTDGAWNVMQPATLASHTHFHYVMRLVQHPSNAGVTYVTDNNSVNLTTNGGGAWSLVFDTSALIGGGGGSAGIHLHGLGIYAPANDPPPPSSQAVLYVGTGHGNWGTDTAQARIWRATSGGQNQSNWAEVTGGPPPPNGDGFPQPNPTQCNPSTNTESGCFSLYSIAVSPINPNTVFVGTFGSENDPGKTIVGKGIGVVRSTVGGTHWQVINSGLCNDGLIGPCNGSPNPGSLSLFVGTVTIDKEGNFVYIATLNGIYSMSTTGNTWQDISGALPTRRFEAITVDPNDSTILYAGTSGLGAIPPAQPPDAQIFKGQLIGGVWQWNPMSFPLPPIGPMQPLAWSDRYRVRDIQAIAPTNGQTKAYAVIEGGGIYSFSTTNVMQRARHR
ncbi:MAG: hypothetical protein HYR55_16460 [Acidobacteria bacterium]|nr:hypothetical protein [Acidobacteriota bacterium]MBI3658119.1 hypothetical protein [Acidobacteriota bacterium]